VSSFVGRRDAISEIRGLLSHARLVTLAGPAGVGKTRLAIQVARGLQKTYRDGAWLVECAELRDPNLLSHLVAASLALKDQAAGTAEDALAAHLADRRLLLVLDNCEHLLEGCAPLLIHLLRAAPELQVLATSREPIAIPGEHVYTVPPFPVPHRGEVDSLRVMPARDALDLFEQRAAAVVPGFKMDAETEGVVTQLCARLDGIPLAIELAAVRLRALSPQRILDRLDDDLDVLASRQRDPTSRHQTLGAAIDWSHDLCSPEQQRVWARLSVFPGSFDLEAATAVCSDVQLAPEAVTEAVIQLVDKSIIVHERHNGTDRFRLLMTLRQYGRQQLDKSYVRELAERHRDHVLNQVECAERGWQSGRQARSAAAIDEEAANLRAALEHCFGAATGTSAHQVTSGLRIATSLWFVWIRGAAREGGHWLDQGIAAADALGDDPGCTDLETVAENTLSRALCVRGWIAAAQGDTTSARRALDRVDERARDSQDEGLRAAIAQATGAVELAEGDPAKAASQFEVAVASHRRGADWSALGLLALAQLAWMRALLGDAAGAVNLCRECQQLSEARGDRWALSWTWWVLGTIAWGTGDDLSAQRYLQMSLTIRRELRDWLGIPFAIEVLAWAAHRQGDTVRGAKLLGANDALWQPIGRPLFGFNTYTRLHESHRAALADEPSDSPHRQAYLDGRALSADAALAVALEEPLPAEQADSLPEANALTRREREVAVLVARGMTNRDIALRLVLSQRTVEAHVQRILVKFGINSRHQVAAGLEVNS
jgi:predicted ATPase/DNA-binding NarL/FixJ family response regulator